MAAILVYCTSLGALHAQLDSSQATHQVDVVVYGATPAGIAAAVSAAKDNCSVLLVEPSHQIGGHLTVDSLRSPIRSFECLSGFHLEFAKQVKTHYLQTYGPNSKQVNDCLEGTLAEPEVNLLIFEKLLAAEARIRLQRQYLLLAVEVVPDSIATRSIQQLTFSGPGNIQTKVGCRIVIDATYDGDLMAMAGAPWTIGRESQNVYGESQASEPGGEQSAAHAARSPSTRDTRRVIGEHIYIQQDSEAAPADNRAVLHLDSIAMADYGNCPDADPAAPYQIPYGVLVTREISNLLVSTAVSSSYVGLRRLRSEPVWMTLGQASGHAAALAIDRRTSVQTIPVRQLQYRLHQNGAATIFVSDVLPGDANFAAVQWWAGLGGYHGVHSKREAADPQGRNFNGRFLESPVGHAADLESPLDQKLRQRWTAIAVLTGFDAPAVDRLTKSSTRGEFIQIAYALASERGIVQSLTSIPKLNPVALPNLHPPGEVDNIDLVSRVIVDATSLPGIVVDDSAAILTGRWQYSTHTPPYVGRGYLHDLKEDKGAKSATYIPVIPRDGEYEVRVSHCYNIRRATNTVVLVHHADGETKFAINQQEKPEHFELFRSLGNFRFEKGRAGFVRIVNEGTPGKVAIADAVQFLATE